MYHFIAGVYTDRGLAERVITALGDMGVPTSDISLVVREVAEEDVSGRGSLDATEQPFVGLAIHSAWERMGWQNAARPAYRDQVPPNIELAILAAGPVAIGIGGAQVGATAGGVVGSIGNFGFTLDQARRFYDRVLDGGAFVMVRTDTAGAGSIRELMRRFEPELEGEAVRAW
jgi:hypothetical protein